jgi:hypothetical protein
VKNSGARFTNFVFADTPEEDDVGLRRIQPAAVRCVGGYTVEVCSRHIHDAPKAVGDGAADLGFVHFVLTAGFVF